MNSLEFPNPADPEGLQGIKHEPAKVAEHTLQISGERDDNPASDQNSAAWRDELATRLNRYRSRRKAHPPRYPSLRLRFEPEETFRGVGSISGDASSVAPIIQQHLSDRALAIEPSTPAQPETSLANSTASPACAGATVSSPPNPLSHSVAKIIEFPRSTASEAPPPIDELAEPVLRRPRILEAPEIASAPALGGITIEGVKQKEIEKRPGIDFPLQPAPLARRLVAAIIDWLVVAAATALFALIFWKINAVRPPRFQIFGLAAGIPCLLWAAYQYLQIVYSGSTPGLRLAGLDVTQFNGASANRARRRWRVLASYLSAVSLGMGYAWLFLDEDTLCWHDRITRTYLAPKEREPVDNRV